MAVAHASLLTLPSTPTAVLSLHWQNRASMSNLPALTIAWCDSNVLNNQKRVSIVAYGAQHKKREQKAILLGHIW